MSRLAAAALLALAAGLALAAWGPTAQAGTQDAPEITDAPNDHQLSPEGQDLSDLGTLCGAGAPCLNRIDFVSAWIDMETPAQFNLNILLSNAPAAASEYNCNYEVHATFGGKEVVSTITTDSNGPVAGDNVAAVAADGNTLVVTIAKSVYGAPADGQQLTGLFLVGVANLGANGMDLGVELASDRAPDADGVAYTFGSGAGGNGTGNGTALDKDHDGLNDTWEQKFFNGTAAQNGTGDPDHDGLNNTAEQKAGTDPTKADTDGDGLNDKQDPFPLDPSKPGGAGGGNGTGNGTGAGDSDHDGLADSWERQHFGNLNQTGSGDPDHDTLNNTAEQRLGTDPSKADTDGDGLSDATDPHPLTKAADKKGRPELYTGAAMFAVAATLCLFGLARP